MRTGKALARKTGISLCSRTMLCFYLVTLAFLYILATMYTASVSQRRHIASLEKELNSKRAKALELKSDVQASTGGEEVAKLKAQLKESNDQLARAQAAQLAVQAQSAALQAQQAQAVHPPPPAEAPKSHKEPEKHAPIQVPEEVHKPPARVDTGAALREHEAVAHAAAESPPAAAPAAAPDAGAQAPPAAEPVSAPTGGKHGAADTERRNAVKAALLHSWEGYKKYAWGTDELMPQARTGHNWLGQAGTIVDVMSTLAVMGEVDEFKKAAEFVKKDLHFHNRGDVSMFETCIRILGGLVSSYEFSCDLYECDQGLLDKAKDIGDRLIKAFNTPSGIPYATINLANGRGSTPGWTGGSAILAEAGSVQLEFGSLSKHLKDPSYEEKVLAVFRKLKDNNPADGLMPLYIDIHSGRFTSAHVSLGAMGDSAFEYLLKVWVQRGKKDQWIKDFYDQASEGMIRKMIQKSRDGHTYIAEKKGGSLIHKMDHLACFVGGMFALGASFSNDPEKHMEVAKGIGETCYQMYHKMKSGLAPENSEFGSGELRPGAVYNIQRPETVETLFYLWRFTKDPIWREHGWEIFQAFERCCKIPTGGYVGVRDVRQEHPPKDDTQQTFWLAETLKYLYLLFSEDELIPLDKYVFNTEAHPLKIWTDAK